ncbi:hypothetical protein ADUPG1_002950, partial [Aduncisulcus paluster]
DPTALAKGLFAPDSDFHPHGCCKRGVPTLVLAECLLCYWTPVKVQKFIMELKEECSKGCKISVTEGEEEKEKEKEEEEDGEGREDALSSSLPFHLISYHQTNIDTRYGE